MTSAIDRAAGHSPASLGRLALATSAILLLGACQSETRYHAPISTSAIEIVPTTPDAAEAAPASAALSTVDVANLAVLALDIESTNGSVRVEVDPKVTGVIVEAKALDAKGHLIKPVQDGELPWVRAQLSAEEGRGVLRITSEYEVRDAQGQPAPAFVMLRVRVPQCEGVRVRNSNGLVELVNVAGALNVENLGTEDRNADIEVRTSKVLSDPISLSTSKGDVLLRMPPGSKGKFELQSPSGETQFLVRSGKVDNAFQKLTTYQATLNGGTNPVLVSTQDGSARVEVRDPKIHSANFLY